MSLLEHPKIGRNNLIFWNRGGRNLRTEVTQTVQHKLLMPHPNDCGRNRHFDRATTDKRHRT
jgi:hypothetical protein